MTSVSFEGPLWKVLDVLGDQGDLPSRPLAQRQLVCRGGDTTVFRVDGAETLDVLSVASDLPAGNGVTHAKQAGLNGLSVGVLLGHDISRPFVFDVFRPVNGDDLRVMQMHEEVAHPWGEEDVCVNQNDARQLSCLARRCLSLAGHAL